MKIALYCPNKPLSHPHPSGDLIIARGIHRSLNLLGHDCREIVEFRSRWFWTSPSGWLKAYAAFLHAFKSTLSFKPQVWLTYHTYYKCPDVLGPWISRLLNIPYVLFQPMYGTRRRKEQGTRTGFYLNRLAIKVSDHAFANNLDDLEALKRLLPLKRITYLPPGIFPEEFRRDENAGQEIRMLYGIPKDTPLLMSAARLRADVKFESMAYLINSLSLLTQRSGDFELLIVGDGPMESRLKQLARELLPGKVIFCGRVERAKMAQYYSAADLFVFPGIGESLGMVFIEAQSCGLPVVALESTGTLQVIKNNETGLLVTDDGGQAIACAVENLLKDRELRRKLGSEGAKFIREERNLHRNYLRLSMVLQDIYGYDQSRL